MTITVVRIAFVILFWRNYFSCQQVKNMLTNTNQSSHLQITNNNGVIVFYWRNWMRKQCFFFTTNTLFQGFILRPLNNSVEESSTHNPKLMVRIKAENTLFSFLILHRMNVIYYIFISLHKICPYGPLNET